MCGEKIPIEKRAVYLVGSPPRVRGKAGATGAGKSVVRITPACAGKRRFPLHQALKSKDHPRVCGEKLLYMVLFRLNLGSPPRVRGKVARL